MENNFNHRIPDFGNFPNYQWSSNFYLNVNFYQVPSATSHFEQRKKIRNTWGGAPSTYQDKRVYFFLGKPENHSIQDEILKENLYYGDIIQAGQ